MNCLPIFFLFFLFFLFKSGLDRTGHEIKVQMILIRSTDETKKAERKRLSFIVDFNRQASHQFASTSVITFNVD